MSYESHSSIAKFRQVSDHENAMPIPKINCKLKMRVTRISVWLVYSFPTTYLILVPGKLGPFRIVYNDIGRRDR